MSQEGSKAEREQKRQTILTLMALADQASAESQQRLQGTLEVREQLDELVKSATQWKQGMANSFDATEKALEMNRTVRRNFEKSLQEVQLHLYREQQANDQSLAALEGLRIQITQFRQDLLALYDQTAPPGQHTAADDEAKE